MIKKIKLLFVKFVKVLSHFSPEIAMRLLPFYVVVFSVWSLRRRCCGGSMRRRRAPWRRSERGRRPRSTAPSWNSTAKRTCACCNFGPPYANPERARCLWETFCGLPFSHAQINRCKIQMIKYLIIFKWIVFHVRICSALVLFRVLEMSEIYYKNSLGKKLPSLMTEKCNVLSSFVTTRKCNNTCSS